MLENSQGAAGQGDEVRRVKSRGALHARLKSMDLHLEALGSQRGLGSRDRASEILPAPHGGLVTVGRMKAAEPRGS